MDFQYYVFKTNIKDKKSLDRVRPFLRQHPIISSWSVDIEDIDNVLRVKIADQLKEADVIWAINQCGFLCEALPD